MSISTSSSASSSSPSSPTSSESSQSRDFFRSPEDLSSQSLSNSMSKKLEEVRYQKLATLLKHFGAVLEMALAAKSTPIKPGVRVIRGPDWNWKDQDGGEGHLGTIVEIGSADGSKMAGSSTHNPKDVVIVQWDNGARSNYRIGYQNAFDLRVWDNAQIGTRHPAITCANCKEQGFFGFRWRSTVDGTDLCNQCYMSDKLNLSHPHRRYDSPESSGSIEVPPRNGCRKILTRGILPGAKVVRGHDWAWENQDGGSGNMGQVVALEGWENDTGRSVVKVFWPVKSQNYNYRLGHRGKVDLKYVPDFSGWGDYCYPDHLPVVGKPDTSGMSHSNPASATPSQFVIGEWVKIAVNASTLKVLQEGHGGYNTKMSKFIGKVGHIHRITGKGDVRVQYLGEPLEQHRWTLNPRSLIKASRISVGDTVQVTEDIDLVREKQPGHGEWDENMQNLLGKTGTVVNVYADGVVRVDIRGQTWTFHPVCLTPVSKETKVEMKTGLDRTGSAKEDAELSQFFKSCERGQIEAVAKYISTLNQNRVDLKAIRKGLQRAACTGSLPIVKYLIERFPEQVDLKHQGKTPLLVATHQGHLDIVDYLLSVGAQLSTNDDFGDQALHYAAFGKQATVVEFILERDGFDINALNAKKCSALHVAVILGLPDCVDALLKHNPDVNLKESFGDTPLHEAITQGHTTIFDMLLNVSSIDLTITNGRGFNPLHWAALKGNAYALKAIIQKAPEMITLGKEDGFTPLHIACVNGHIELVKALLASEGCNVNAKDKRGQTPLHSACDQGLYRIVEVLLHNDFGADVCCRDLQGNTPLHLVLAREDDPSAKLNQPLDVDPSILSQVKKALVKDNLQKWIALAILLILNGANSTLRNRNGHTPLDRVKDPASRTLIYQKTVEYTSEEIGQFTTGQSVSPRKARGACSRAAPDPSKLVECTVCSEMVYPCKFMPCGHMVACEECSFRMKKCIECKQTIDEKILCPEMDSTPSHSSGDVQSTSRLRDLEAKVQYLEDQYNCSICMERKKNVVFLCGHGSCSECAETLKSCHMCRKPIAKTINLY
eukprot:TCALIF_11037-PA protein Name:"Similar to MIB2 E3 ubiquitin-protein ligase MIB2 (Gallus gallus)" AED:0.04 eAED:0.04 QI:0/0/0/0.5/1/1/2/0/1055